MADVDEAPAAGGLSKTAPLQAPALEGTSVAERAALHRQIAGTLARTCLNLGVLQAQGQRFSRAAAFFEQAAAIDPAYPRVQYSLGVAYFNGGDYAKATPALQRAIDAEPQNAEARRMLAMASLNTGEYARAAELLAGDPQRGTDPSIEYSYGLALVRSDRGGGSGAGVLGAARGPWRQTGAERGPGTGPRTAGRLRRGDQASCSTRSSRRPTSPKHTPRSASSI